jgi:hypothetical protein
VLSTTDRCRCIQLRRGLCAHTWGRANGCNANHSGGWRAAAGDAVQGRGEGFYDHECPFNRRDSRQRLPVGPATRLLTAFVSAHQPAIAGSVEGSTASFRGGKGAQDG